MRVTSTSTYAVMRGSLGTSLAGSATCSRSSARRRINAMSDDPVGAATALRYRAYEADQAAYPHSAANANTWLSGSDTALQSMSGALRRVRELAINATNGSLSTEARKAISAQITALRHELADLANTPHGGQALFGGQRHRRQPAADGTWTFSGDDGRCSAGSPQGTVRRQHRRPDRVRLRPAGRPGPALGHRQHRRRHALRRRGRARHRPGRRSPTARRRPGRARPASAPRNRVEAPRARSEQFVDQVHAERSAIEDIDLAEAILQLNTAQTGYQAALGAVAKANLPSLADFLR